MKINSQISVPDEVKNLDTGTDRQYKRILTSLTEEFKDKLPYAIGLASREYWYACFRSAIYMELSFSGQSLPLTGTQKQLISAAGYAAYEGWAATLYDGLSDIEPPKERYELLKGTPFSNLLDNQSILYCMALYWLAFANDLIESGNVTDALGFIHEAHDSLSLATGLGMYKAGEESGREEEKLQQRNSFALSGANARHTKTRAIRAEAVRLYSSRSWPSMLQAAKNITPEVRAFCEQHGYAPLSSDRAQQTIYEWIRATASKT